jgi:hypothetical protein
LLGCLLGATTLSISAAAGAETQSYIDLQAGLGYSTNPLLVRGDSAGATFGRVSASAFHGWSTERSQTGLSAYVENSTYFRRYSNKQAFSLSANTSRSVSETLRLFGDVAFSGDFGGQLSSRFIGGPVLPATPATQPTLVPTIPATVVVVDPELYGLNQRQYNLSGRVGGSVTLSPRDSLTAIVGIRRLFVGGESIINGSNNDLDYMQYDGSLSYDRQINERLTVGGRLIAFHTNYAQGRSVTAIGPQATVRARLTEGWDATAGVGFVYTRQDAGLLGGNDSSIDLSLDGSLCRALEFERICARVSRQTQSSVVGAASTSTSIAADYSRRLSARDSIQGSLSVTRSGSFALSNSTARSTFYSLAGSYDRQISDRLSAGATATVRKLATFGPDPKIDAGANVYLRYRIGDVR